MAEMIARCGLIVESRRGPTADVPFGESTPGQFA
jgi:hypothetical protein